MHHYINARSAVAFEQQAKRAAKEIAPAPHREQLSASVHSGAGEQLPKPTLSQMEAQFKYDFSRVRVHCDDDAAISAAAISARAFTSGNNVFFGAGEYQPQTAAGQRLIAHELTHVIQQRASLDAPAIQRDDEKEGKEKPTIGV